jgi:hypothetical protein
VWYMRKRIVDPDLDNHSAIRPSEVLECMSNW